MKKAIIMTSLIAIYTNSANASFEHIGTIVTHNIANTQHTINQLFFSNSAFKQNVSQSYKNNKNLYGHAPMYGKMRTYGEYNDDGSFGRSGGDTYNSVHPQNIWFDWQHNTNKVNYTSIPVLKNNTDIVIAGITNAPSKTSKWGMYAGYINSRQDNSTTDIKNQGGYIGIHSGFTINNFSTYATLTGGILDTSDVSLSDTYTNMWLSGNLKASYDWNLDTTFTLQPAVHIGYTWIASGNYTAVTNEKVTNDNTNIFTITPEISAIKHIGNNWYGTLGVKYIISHIDSNSYINNIVIPELNYDNYFEYAINICKKFNNTDIHATFGRHDGHLYGWFGNLGIRYSF